MPGEHSNNLNGLLLAAAVIGTGYVLYTKVLVPQLVVPKKLLKQVTRMQITRAKVGLDIKNKKLWLSFVINNPNTQAMVITAIVAHATVYQADPKKPGFRIGDVDNFTKITIAPTAATPVKLTFEIKAVNAIAYLASVLSGNWQGQIFDFQGTITANGNPWPIHERVKLSK